MNIDAALIRFSLWLSSYQPPRFEDLIAQLLAINPFMWMDLALTRLVDVPFVGTVALSLYDMATPFVVLPAVLWTFVSVAAVVGFWFFLVPSVFAVLLFVLTHGMAIGAGISHLLGGLR